MQYLDKTLTKQLAELGFMAAFYGEYKICDDICAGLMFSEPDSAVPYMILAVSAMNKGDTQAAIDLLEKKATQKSPDEPLIAALQGLAYSLAGLSQSSEMRCQDVLQRDNQSEAAKLANAVLGTSELNTSKHNLSFAGALAW